MGFVADCGVLREVVEEPPGVDECVVRWLISSSSLSELHFSDPVCISLPDAAADLALMVILLDGVPKLLSSCVPSIFFRLSFDLC